MKALALIVPALALSLTAFAHIPGKSDKISPEKATKIAQKVFKGKLMKAPVLEHEDGHWQYEVLLKKKGQMMEIDVDCHTGRVLNVEKTTAAEEAREAISEKKKH